MEKSRNITGKNRRPPTIFPPHTPLYFDYNATTPVDSLVSSAMMPYITSMWGNPSSSHYYGKGPKQAVELARRQIAKAVNAESFDTITFTSGGTESANWAITGTVSIFKKEYDELVLNGVLPRYSIPHIITSAIEHPCVLKVCEYLEETKQCELTVIPVNEKGVVDVRDVLTSVKPTTCLITIMHANNEVGSIQPIPEISRALKATIPEGIRPLLHTDASQSLGKIPVDIDVLGVDFLTIAGHKLYAPKGIGALYMSTDIGKRLNGKPFPLFMHGGGQEKGKRAGTENVMLIAGLGKGAELVTGKDAHAQHVKYEILTQSFLRQLRAKCAGGVKMNGPKNHRFEADEEYANQIILGNIDNDRNYYNGLGNGDGNRGDDNNDIYSASLLRPRNWKRLPNTLSVGFAGLKAKDLIDKTKGKLAFSAAAACHSPTGGEDQGVSAVLRAMGVDINYAKGTVRLSVGRYTTESEIVMASRILSEAANELWGASGRGYYNDSESTTKRQNKTKKSNNNNDYSRKRFNRNNRSSKVKVNNYVMNDNNGNRNNNNSNNNNNNQSRNLPRYMQGTVSSKRMVGMNRRYHEEQRKHVNDDNNRKSNGIRADTKKRSRNKAKTFQTPHPIVYSPSWQTNSLGNGVINSEDNHSNDQGSDTRNNSSRYYNSTERNEMDYFEVDQIGHLHFNDEYNNSNTNLYNSPNNYNISPPTNVRVSIKKIMDTVEKEKRRINNIHYNVIDEIQKQQNTKEEETFGDEEKDDNKRDYAADGLGTNDWRADFDRVLARSRAALFRAQEE